MKLIYFQGDSDYSAVEFHNRIREKEFSLKKLATQLSKADDKSMDIAWKEGRHRDGGYITLYEFGEVDPLFVKFVQNIIQDYDATKQSDFYIVEK